MFERKGQKLGSVIVSKKAAPSESKAKKATESEPTKSPADEGGKDSSADEK